MIHPRKASTLQRGDRIMVNGIPSTVVGLDIEGAYRVLVSYKPDNEPEVSWESVPMTATYELEEERVKP